MKRSLQVEQHMSQGAKKFLGEKEAVRILSYMLCMWESIL